MGSAKNKVEKVKKTSSMMCMKCAAHLIISKQQETNNKLDQLKQEKLATIISESCPSRKEPNPK